MSLDHVDVGGPISILQRIENENDLTGSEKNQIKAVKTELWFLRTLLPVKPEARQIGIIMDAARALFQSDYHIMLDGKEPHNFDANCSKVLADIQHYKRGTRVDISNLEISSTSPLSYKLLTEFIDNVVLNLKDLLIVRFGEPPSAYDPVFLSMYYRLEIQTEVVEKELTALKNIVFFLGKILSSEQQKCWQTFLRYVEFVATLAAIIFFLYMPTNLCHDEYIVPEFSNLLRKTIKPIEPQMHNIYSDVLRDLRSSSIPLMSYSEPAARLIDSLKDILTKLWKLYTLCKDQMETLDEQLNLLEIILGALAAEKSIQGKWIHFFGVVETLVIDAGLIVYSLYDSSKSREDRNRDLLLLADKIQLVDKQRYQIYQLHLPKYDVLVFSVLLLDRLKELLRIHSDSLASVKDKLELIYEELQVQPFLEDIAIQGHHKPGELLNVAERVLEKAYKVEYIVDSFIVRDIPRTYLTVWLSEIMSEIKLIKRELTKSSEKKTEIASPAVNEELVGFNNVREPVRGGLVGGSPEVDVVSIASMPGTAQQRSQKQENSQRNISHDPIDVYDPISILQRIENNHDRTGIENNQIKAVKIELWFLRTLLRRKPEALQIGINSIMDNAGALFRSDYNIMLGGKESHNFEANCSKVLAEIQHYKRSTRADLSNLEIASTSPLCYELLIEFIDSVVQNLKDLLIVYLGEPPAFHSELQSMYFQMKRVEKELRALKNIVFFLGKRCSSEFQPNWQTFLHHVEFVTTLAATIFFLYMPDLNDEKFVALLSDLLKNKIKPIEPNVRIIYTDVLREIRFSSTHTLSHVEAATGFSDTLLHMLVELRGSSSLNWDQTRTLHEQLNSLRIFLNELRLINDVQDDTRINFFKQLEPVVIYAGLVIYSLCDDNQISREQNLQVLYGMIQNVKTRIFMDIREWVQSHLPKNDALSFSSFLLDSLRELLFSHSGSLASVKNHFEVIYEELEYFQPFLKHVAEQGNNKHDKLQDLVARVVDKAYEVEYIVDSFAVKDVPLSYLTMWLSEIIREIKLIKTELTKSRENPPTNKEELVGFKDVRETINGQLLGGSKEGQVVPITGMAGSGKTTLALSLKNDSRLVSHFDFWSECHVSQEYTCRDLVLSILSNASYESSELSKLSKPDLMDKLRKTLIGKRYLLIIDDLWEIKAWDELVLCFPDFDKGSRMLPLSKKNNNGCRIILTTRNNEIASQASPGTKPVHISPLSEQESWLLLQKKVFGEEICPRELKEVGQQIAKKCEGLPLYVVLVAALLRSIDKTEQWWKRMESRFSELIRVDANASVKLSYNHLPDTLKPCLLYFGAISEGNDISVSKLTSLWIAEGFIGIDGEICLEDSAECYLEDLIRRNLVMVAKRSTTKIKACRLHDQVLEFCKVKAKQDNFLVCLQRDEGANPPQFFSEKPSHRRLSFCSSGDDDLAEWRPSCSHAHTVLFREAKDGTLPSLGHASIIFGSFKFLRVLDLEFIVVESFPTELNQLRFLALQTTEGSVPSSIENLSYLQTFIVKTTGGQQLQLPDTFWGLIKLRHVSISNRAVLNLNDTQESLDGNLSKLDNLATLSSICFSRVEDVERILRKTPNLRKLKCEFADSWVWGKNENRFPLLDSLSQLETLKVAFTSIPDIGPSRLNFPNLKKLTLCNFPLPLAEISTIAKVASLEILKLQQVVFEGEEWEVRDEEFPRLRLLKLENFKLSKWRVSDGAFPCLEKLVLHGCLHLEEIPDCFGELPTLKCIEVKSCNESVSFSAMYIKELRLEYGDDTLQVCSLE